MFKRAAVVFLAFVVLAAIPAQARQYVEKFDPNNPSIFGGVFVNGPDGAWDCMLSQGHYLMTNTNPGGGSVRYYHVTGISGETDQTLANCEISARVKGRCDGPLGGAGLIYRLNPKTGTYWAFVIDDKGGYAIYKRGPAGMRKVMGGVHSAIKAGDVNLLTVKPAANGQVEFVVNGQPVATLGSGDIDGHAPGIVVISPCSYDFQEVAITTTP